MRKFKLIKLYPGSPKLGATVVDTNINNGAKDAYFSENWGKSNSGSAFIIGKNHDCENQPEFWQEIIEKDYQILKLSLQRSVKPEVVDVSDSGEEYILSLLKCNGNSIHSVKRLSDGEIFTVGDNIQYYHKNTKIKSIYYNEHNQLSFKVEGVSAPLTGVFGTSKLDKVKEVLFTTEDGVDIFEGDKYYSINANLKEKIQEIFTTKDTIKSCFYRYFSTKKAAEDYIIRNKPCLSIQDVDSISEWDELIESLEELVKSRL